MTVEGIDAISADERSTTVDIPAPLLEFSNLAISGASISKGLRSNAIMWICSAERWSSIWKIISSFSLVALRVSPLAYNRKEIQMYLREIKLNLDAFPLAEGWC